MARNPKQIPVLQTQNSVEGQKSRRHWLCFSRSGCFHWGRWWRGFPARFPAAKPAASAAAQRPTRRSVRPPQRPTRRCAAEAAGRVALAPSAEPSPSVSANLGALGAAAFFFHRTSCSNPASSATCCTIFDTDERGEFVQLERVHTLRSETEDVFTPVYFSTVIPQQDNGNADRNDRTLSCRKCP